MSKLTPKMADRITRILHFPLTTHIAKQLRDQGITSNDLDDYSSRVGWAQIYNALRDMEKANLAFPLQTSGQYPVKPEDLPELNLKNAEKELDKP